MVAFLASGYGKGIFTSAEVIPTGTSIADAFQLSATLNLITETEGDAADTGLILPIAVAGTFLMIDNQSGHTVIVYGSEPETIYGGSISLSNLLIATFFCAVSGTWSNYTNSASND